MSDLSTNNHFERLRKLLELEEAEEISQFKQEFLVKSPEERERSGKALLRLRIVEFHYSPGSHRLITFSYASGKALPIYSPDVGDVVSLSRESGESFDLPIGTVYEKTTVQITVAFNREPPDWVSSDRIYHLNLAGNRATYKRIFEVLKWVRSAEKNRLAFLRDLSLGLKLPAEINSVPVHSISFFNPELNEWQKRAVQSVLQAEDICLIQGPPGTGKTTVLVEVIRQAVRSGNFVFATAPSNTACDHLLECLVKAGVSTLRIGHPARILRHLRDHTLDFKLSSHPHSKMVDELEAELHRLYRKRERGEEKFTITRDMKHQMADEIKHLKFEIRTLENNILKNVLQNASVIIGTHMGAADPILKGKTFDLLVMDEATQSIEPSSWLPLMSAKKAVLAGDHFQLPPTILSRKAEEGGLGITLFERFHKLLGEEFRTLLKIQYRMNEKIMNFSSREFYSGEMVAHESVKDHTLAGLANVTRAPETEEAFLYIDTAGRGFEEALEPGSESKYNVEEAKLVIRSLEKLLQLGVEPNQIGLISPYSAQTRLLGSFTKDPGIEVDSVDSFQGREKEVIIVSLVRSNLTGEMGFLADTRRMNVAMTRARRKLIVIGDSATLASIPFYRDFIKYAESIGAYKSSWEDV